jgi:hypothetical protein
MKHHKKMLDNIDALHDLERTHKKSLLHKQNSFNFIRVNPHTGNPIVKADVEREKLRISDINEQMPDLEQSIHELRNSVTTDLITKHNDIINTVQSEIEGYQQLIAAQQQIIEKANDEPDPTIPLMVKREDLLTDIALGKDKAGELSNLDAEIGTIKAEQATTRTDNKNAINQAEQTINGLNRRVIDTQERLRLLQAYTPKIIDAYLMAKANQAAIEFNAMTQEISERMTNLICIDSIIKEFGQRENTGLFYRDWLLKIPLIASDKPIPYTEIRTSSHHCVDSHSQDFIKETNAKIIQLKNELIEQGIIS